MLAKSAKTDVQNRRKGCPKINWGELQETGMHRTRCAKDRCSKETVFSRLSFQEDIFGEENLTHIVFCTNQTDVKTRFSKFS